MPTLYTLEGALDQADTIATAYADAEVHLFNDTPIDLSPSTTLAELEAIESAFTGYAEAVIAAWLGPMLAPGSGAMIWSGGVIFTTDAPYTVGENVQGWWLQTTGGVLICAGTFPTLIPMVGPGNMIPWELYLPFGTNLGT